ncbi:hypothetical protein [Kordia sp.]|uniref:hypothetical protein n=1 Tax=Kordia sp. TaxID=1965332 RepID=UPI0025C20AE0|nr:hypothetical protein [Kordia sp.]MCH2195255.1 hypothetical protein [Kordia sp.]
MTTENLDTIYIELLVQACQIEAKNIWMQGSLEVRIGSKKPYEGSDIIMADLFMESMKREGTYFIFSCSCGIRECGGCDQGIEVKHEKNVIVWNMLDHNKTYRFDRKRIEADIEEAIQEVKNYKAYFKKKEIEYVGFGYNLNSNA